MQIWLVEDSAPRRMVDAASVASLVDAIGAENQEVFARRVLETVGEMVSAQVCTVMAHESRRTPRVLSAAAQSGPWLGFSAGAVHAREFSREDVLRDVLDRQPAVGPIGVVLVCRQRTDDVPAGTLRTEGLEAFGLLDRLTVLARVGEADWLATHVYRTEGQALFCRDDVDSVSSMARLLARCMRHHYQCDVDGMAGLRGRVSGSVRDIGERLTVREKEVLTRILDGVTVNRIAEDLKLRPTTVATYRQRAYEKLGVTSRQELFATILQYRPPTLMTA